MLLTAVCAPSIAAFGGAFVRITGGAEFENYWQFWAEWYIANALASLTLGAMVLMSLATNWEEFRSRSRRIEASLLVVGLGIACTIAFTAHPFAKPHYIPSLLYLPLPFVVWAAVRCETVGATGKLTLGQPSRDADQGNASPGLAGCNSRLGRSPLAEPKHDYGT